METLRVKPTDHKVKSHMRAEEESAYGIRNPATVERLICHETVDVAAAAYADHLGEFDKTLKSEERFNAQRWRVLKRTSGIELDIRTKESDLAAQRKA